MEVLNLVLKSFIEIGAIKVVREKATAIRIKVVDRLEL